MVGFEFLKLIIERLGNLDEPLGGTKSTSLARLVESQASTLGADYVALCSRILFGKVRYGMLSAIF